MIDSQVGFACDRDLVTLYCADNKTINIESAHYGVYADACDVRCCGATSADCTESLEETAPGDWLLLTAACQNQTFCQVEHPGRWLDSCPDDDYSDYIVVTYKCQPGTGSQTCIIHAAKRA